MRLLFCKAHPNICAAFQLAFSIRKVGHAKQLRRVLNIPSKATVQSNSLKTQTNDDNRPHILLNILKLEFLRHLNCSQGL
jgi:hypothetical protein